MGKGYLRRKRHAAAGYAGEVARRITATLLSDGLSILEADASRRPEWADEFWRHYVSRAGHGAVTVAEDLSNRAVALTGRSGLGGAADVVAVAIDLGGERFERDAGITRGVPWTADHKVALAKHCGLYSSRLGYLEGIDAAGDTSAAVNEACHRSAIAERGGL